MLLCVGECCCEGRLFVVVVVRELVPTTYTGVGLVLKRMTNSVHLYY